MEDREEFDRMIAVLSDNNGRGLFSSDSEALSEGHLMFALIAKWFDARLSAIEERDGGWRK